VSGLDLYANYLASLPKPELQMIARETGVQYYGWKSREQLVQAILSKNAEQAAQVILNNALAWRNEYEPYGNRVVRGDKLKALVKAIDDYSHYQELIGLLDDKLSSEATRLQ